MKIDRRINYRIVVDTETCPLDKDFEGVSPQNMFVYDIGWAVVDKRGKVYRTRSFINADVFIAEKELMKSAYYANKVPKYWEEIKSGDRILTAFSIIRKIFLEDMAEFEITEIYAHNMRFDYGSLNNTERYLTKSKYRYFFPYNVEICDTLRMARDVLGTMPTYKKFCEKNGFLTKNGQPQMKAETIYRFITKNLDFVESHTGLEDVMIEKDILAYCYRQHKKMNRLCWDNQSHKVNGQNDENKIKNLYILPIDSPGRARSHYTARGQCFHYSTDPGVLSIGILHKF